MDAEMDELESEKEALERQIKEQEKAMALAYGWLWHSLTGVHAVVEARKVLFYALTEEARLWGIEEAKKQGAVATDPWRS
jgi:hypothetical protein